MSPEHHWEFCQIEYAIWYDPLTGGEGVTIQQNGWLRFVGRASGRDKSYLAGQSREVPVIRLPGSPAIPERRNPIHQSLHQEFLHSLIESGWELLAEKGDPWWARRLRRRVQEEEKR